MTTTRCAPGQLLTRPEHTDTSVRVLDADIATGMQQRDRQFELLRMISGSGRDRTGPDWLTKRKQRSARMRLGAQLERLGHTVILDPSA